LAIISNIDIIKILSLSECKQQKSTKITADYCTNWIQARLSNTKEKSKTAARQKSYFISNSKYCIKFKILKIYCMPIIQQEVL